MDNLEQYFNSPKGSKLRRDMERRAKSDPELAKELAFEKRLRFMRKHEAGIQGFNDFKKLVADIPVAADPAALRRLEAQEGNFRPPSRMGGKWMAMAAGVVLVLSMLAGGYFLWPQDLTEHIALSKEYMEYTPPLTNAGSDSPTSLKEGLIAYEGERYTEAEAAFRLYLAEHPDDSSILLLQGICLAEQGRYEAASDIFTRFIADGEDINTPDARWYLALCRLAEGHPLLAVNQLQALLDYPPYSEKSARLIREIQERFMEVN